MWGSTIPAAIDALVTALTQADGLGSVAVLDGPEVDASSRDEALIVGAGAVDDPTAVDASTEHEGLSLERDREQYGIRCVLMVRDGSGSVPAARRRAYDLLGAVGAALAADYTLGGAVMTAGLGTHGLSQDQDERGAHIVIAFTIDVDAYTRR